MPFAAARTDLEIIILSEVKNKYHDIAYMCNFKNSTSELIYKTNRITDVENTLVVTKGEWWGGINWEIGINIYTHYYIAQGTLLNTLW